MVKITQTTTPESSKNIDRKWHIVDAKNQILGRVANKIAILLEGKNKTNYVEYLDIGDNIVVINAKLVEVTGNKRLVKTYDSFSGYPGGLKVTTFEKLQQKNPSEIIRQAVSGMLPKNKLRDRRLARLHIYADDIHPYSDKLK
ncbi:MAG: 50S ribosomal protein L13 [Candidatus Roizmanbacteria bacterium]